MKSNVVRISNNGNGFSNALEETKKVAQYNGLNERDAMHLTLCTEEILSLARSVTGEMEASFWLENEDKQYLVHMSTKTVMDKEKRNLLLASATSRKNEAAKTFLGFIRDASEQAMAADVSQNDAIPDEILDDLPNHMIEDTEWDHYELSILRKVADQVKIGIRGGLVEMTVVKNFA